MNWDHLRLEIADLSELKPGSPELLAARLQCFLSAAYDDGLPLAERIELLGLGLGTTPDESNALLTDEAAWTRFLGLRNDHDSLDQVVMAWRAERDATH